MHDIFITYYDAYNPFSHAKDLFIAGEGYILGFKISSRTYNNLNTTLI
jgi:hypothetical protein